MLTQVATNVFLLVKAVNFANASFCKGYCKELFML